MPFEISINDQSRIHQRPLLQKLIDSVLLVGTAVLTIVCGQSLHRALQVYFIENSGLKHSSWANFLLAAGVCLIATLILTLGFSALLDGTTGDVRGCTDWDKVARKIAFYIKNGPDAPVFSPTDLNINQPEKTSINQ